MTRRHAARRDTDHVEPSSSPHAKPGARTRTERRYGGATAPRAAAPIQRAARDARATRDEHARQDHHFALALGYGGAPAPAVQRAQDTDTNLSHEAVADRAAAGVAGPGRPLPHLDTIARAFGPHDVSGVRAHVGGAAASASEAIGARAYATGNDVAFAEEPDLFLAAHEAAHVVQQRQGVHLKGAVGETGDAYEQHADAVAAAVVRGESAAPLLGAPTLGAPATAAPTAHVQRSPRDPTDYLAVPVRRSYSFHHRPFPDLDGDVQKLSDSGTMPIDADGKTPLTRTSLLVKAFVDDAIELYGKHDRLVDKAQLLTVDPVGVDKTARLHGWKGEGFSSAIELALAQRVCEADEPVATVADMRHEEVDTADEKRVVDKALHDESLVQPAIQAREIARLAVDEAKLGVDGANQALETAIFGFERAATGLEILEAKEDLEARQTEKAEIEQRKADATQKVSLGVSAVLMLTGGAIAGAGIGAADNASRTGKVAGTFGGELGGGGAGDLIGAGVEYLVGLAYQEEIDAAQAQVDKATMAVKAAVSKEAYLAVKEAAGVVKGAFIEQSKALVGLRKAHLAYRASTETVARAVNDVGGHSKASQTISGMIRALPIVEQVCGELRGLHHGASFTPNTGFIDGARELLRVGTAAGEVLITYKEHRKLVEYIEHSHGKWSGWGERLREVIASITHSGASDE